MNCRRTFFTAKIAIVIIAFALLFVFFAKNNTSPAQNEITYDEALARIHAKEIKEVVVKNDNVRLGSTGGELVIPNLSDAEIEGLLKEIGSYNAENLRDTIALTVLNGSASNPMDRIFQIIFILFFISPPLIVILLFLIWCELRKRNEK